MMRDKSNQETFDYVVIGAGSTGSVVASRLAQAGASVLVLEAGGSDRRLDVLVPALVSSAYRTANWKYPVEPDPTRTGEGDLWLAGKILGGSGSINACVFVRGNRADYDGWAKLGCTGWDFDSVLPSFKRMETWSLGADEYRGGDGPIRVEIQSDRGAANMAFVEAAVQAGYLENPDYNGASQDGAALIQVNHRRGTRSHASREYLRHVAPKQHLTVHARSMAHRVIFRSDQAVGVEYEHRGRIRRALVDQEVILSAGALASPKILLLSGVGPSKELVRFGIPSVSECPGVGANLQDHSFLPQRWHAKIPTLNNIKAAAALRAGFEYVAYRRGVLAMTMVPVHVIGRTDRSFEAPDLQLQFQSFTTERGTDRHGVGTIRRAKENGFQPGSTLLHPRARGRVGLRSASHEDSPLIDYRFLENKEDLRDLIAAGRELRRIMEQPAMAKITGDQFEPEKSCRSDDEWREYVRRFVRGLSHPVGTCKMGVDDMAVVDPQLRVRGVRGLRVADASIMPAVTTGNTNAPSMMIGERAAELILGERSI
jgi:choline dehydrogenase